MDKKEGILTIVGSHETDTKRIDNSITTTESLLKSCPNPTDAELRKLLAIQGYILQQVGMDLLDEATRAKKGDGKVGLALKAMAASREALKASINGKG